MSRSRWRWLLAVGCALVILIGILRPPHSVDSAGTGVFESKAARGEGDGGPAIGRTSRFARHSSPVPTPTAAEIVAGKLSQFARSRREHVYALPGGTKLRPGNLRDFTRNIRTSGRI